jgi:hypothetical protein
MSAVPRPDTDTLAKGIQAVSSADIISINFASLQAAADSLAVKGKDLQSNMSDLTKSLNPIKASWYASGSSAGEAAEQSETRLRAAIDDIIQVIGRFSLEVEKARETQLALENLNTSYFA